MSWVGSYEIAWHVPDQVTTIVGVRPNAALVRAPGVSVSSRSLKMFIHTQGSLLAYTVASSGPLQHDIEGHITPPWSVGYDVTDLSDPAAAGVSIVQRRIAQDEPIWLQEWDDFGEHSAEVLRGVGTDQFHVLRPVCDLYDASPAETMRAITEYNLEADASTRRLFDVVRNGTQVRSTDSVGWKYRARVSAWLLDQPVLMEYPVAQSLGYSGSVVQRMEARTDGDVPERFDAAYVDAQRAVRSFIEHCQIAAKLALDTPQPVTVTTERGQLVFQNVRVSPSIRGLRVDLPTGGRLFYREASLRPGNGDLIHKGRPLARRRIAHDILRQSAFDVALMSEWHLRTDRPELEMHKAFVTWVKESLHKVTVGAVRVLKTTGGAVGAEEV